MRAWGTSEKFDSAKGGDWIAWVAHFEQVAAANHWTRKQTCNSDIVIPHGLSPTVLSELSCCSLWREFAAPLTGTWQLVCSGIAHIDLHHAGMRTRTQQSGEQLLRSSEETGPTSVPNIGCQCSRRLSQGTVPRWNRQPPCSIGRQKKCSQFVT